MQTKSRGILIDNNKLLLIKRTLGKEEGFIFPGGSVEVGESLEHACIREMKEETNLDVVIENKFCDLKGTEDQQTFFLISKYTGIPSIFAYGTNYEKMAIKEKSPGDYYELVWIALIDLHKIDLYPKEIKRKLIQIYS